MQRMSDWASTIIGVAAAAQTPQGPYWYENLGKDDFQHLCAALVAAKYDNVTVYPVGQPDGGRDIKRKTTDGDLIYQVKWSKNAITNPVSWLTAAINKETDKIKRLVARGATRYILITSVAGTSPMAKHAGRPGSGTMDKLDEELAGYAKQFGLEAMECWWRDDVDALVVNASTNVLWRFQKMLAGTEALRLLLEASQTEISNDRLALAIRKMVSAQWTQDSKVKFKQVKLDNDDLEDLFIDVKAEVTKPVGRTTSDMRKPTGGVEYLVSSKMPFTLVRGEPGQGKSTLGQQLSQVYRSAFVIDDSSATVKRPTLKPPSDRVPVRMDLRDYGSWLEGSDPFAEVIATPGQTPKPRAHGDVERFLAVAVGHWAVVDGVDLAMVNDMLTRYPMLVVFDGLDEVAQRETRVRIVEHIEKFAERWHHGGLPPKVVVTTRPNVADLPEPSSVLFETVSLVKLDRQLRSEYLRKWCAVRNIKGPDKRTLMHSFDTRSAEPHIAQLAENPMQLTILLYLLHERGQSVPDRRTPLYDAYMTTFLNREAETSELVRDNRTDLEEVTAYLGWYLHGCAEQQGASGRLKTAEIRAQIFTYLDAAKKDTRLVNDLFTSVTQRVWALSSKAQGTFEFDVQPIREFFAAKYLYRYASAAHKSDILNALTRRPFWLNVARFFAGFANPNEVGGLVDGLSEELAAGRHPLQTRTAVWTLLADGVFSEKVAAQDRATALLVDDLSVRLLYQEMIAARLPALPASSGAVSLATRLLDLAAAHPDDPLSVEKVGIAAGLGPDEPALGQWWLDHLRPAIGSYQETPWLRLGQSWNGGSLLSDDDRDRLALVDDVSIAVALSAGVTPAAGSALETKIVDSVLAGHCSDVYTVQTGYVADLVNALGPRAFLALAKDAHRPVFETNSAHCGTLLADVKRADALRRLRARDARFGRIQDAMKVVRTSTNTVQAWSQSAEQLRSLYGPSWLATDIAVVGAAIDPDTRRDLGPMNPHGAPFGPDIHYGNLVNDVRLNRDNFDWWTSCWNELAGSDRAAWVYALVAAATPTVVERCLDLVASAVDGLDERALSALVASSSRLGLSGVSRRLPRSVAAAATKMPTPVAVLVTHHADDLSTSSNLAGLFTASQVGEMVTFGVAAWSALRIASRQLATGSTDEWMPVLETFGPHAVAGVAQGPLPAAVCDAILNAPGRFPLKWVSLAEQAVSLGWAEEALLAASEGWFE